MLLKIEMQFFVGRNILALTPIHTCIKTTPPTHLYHFHIHRLFQITTTEERTVQHRLLYALPRSIHPVAHALTEVRVHSHTYGQIE